MDTRTKRIVGLAAVGVLVGGGIAGAVAATSGQDGQATDLANALSKETGQQVNADQVKAAFQDVMKQRLDQEVAAGRMTQAQADQILQQAQQNGGLPGMGRGPGDHHGRMDDASHQAVEAAIQKSLGMTDQAIHAARDNGKTLADLATEKGVAKDDLIAAIAGAMKSSDQSGNLTDAQATQMATHMVNDLDHHMGRGPGGPGGPGNGAVDKAIAKSLGITQAEWQKDEQAGKSAADVAKAKGVDTASVVAAVTAALKANAPQGGGNMTDAQVKQFAEHIVNDAHHGPGGGHMGSPGGPPPDMGGMPPAQNGTQPGGTQQGGTTATTPNQGG